MIYQLSGEIVLKDPLFAVMDVAGVGYGLHVSQKCESSLTLGQSATLHVDTQVRQDAITLYGFMSSLEKQAFHHLISVQGVGGKAALNILSVLTPDELYQAIHMENKALITRADGVGPKIAARIVSELGSKIAKSILSAASSASSSTATSAPSSPHTSSAFLEASQALVVLGYQPMSVHQALMSFKKNNPDADTESLIRGGLSLLAKT